MTTTESYSKTSHKWQTCEGAILDTAQDFNFLQSTGLSDERICDRCFAENMFYIGFQIKNGQPDIDVTRHERNLCCSSFHH